MANVQSPNSVVVPNGGDIAHRWALKKCKGTFLAKGRFRERLGAHDSLNPWEIETGIEKFY